MKNTRDKGCYEFHIVFDWLEIILIEHKNTARGTADKTRQQCNINTLLFMSKLCLFSLYFSSSSKLSHVLLTEAFSEHVEGSVEEMKK